MINKLIQLLVITFALTANATDYYISSLTGLDSNNGLTDTTPWQTLDKLYNTTFLAGDKILFKSGDVWQGMFWLKGSGTAGNPIIVDKYGGTTKPVIDGDGYQASILIYNDDYIEINNLELINEASHLDGGGGTKTLSGFGGAVNSWGNGKYNRFGIKIVASTRSLNYFRIDNSKVHKIYPTPPAGEENDTHYETPNNITKKSRGWGIKIDVQSSDPNYYKINDVKITNSYFTDIGHYGIWIKPLGLAGKDYTFYSSDYSINNCEFNNTGGSGIVPNKSYNVTIENNIFDGTGSTMDDRMWKRGSGLWTFSSKNVIVQHNQFLNVRGWQDSYGAHIDFGNENVVFQYNYSYNNEGGFVEILGDNINCGYRYNISVNDGWRTDPPNEVKHGRVFWVSPYCGQGNGACPNTGSFIYNNTVYVPNNMDPEILVMPKTGDTHIFNNIIYKQTGGTPMATDLTNNSNDVLDVSHNQFYPQSQFVLETELQNNAIYTNPQFVSVGDNDPDSYKLASGSTSIGAGKLINGSTNFWNFLQNNGGLDYFGNLVSSTSVPNIGAYNGAPVLGLNQFKEKSLTYFPNPTNGKITFKTNTSNNKLIVSIYDVTGRFLKNTFTNTVNLEHYPQGIYLLKVTYDSHVETVRIIKQKN
ncbi:T9SS type A sorting domain-containing protein [Polaribacter pectinis]|uniref:T9SS type A sorting domain-containing protein n=1 Tax=Polaribacter pectinis TaxID=2738844 RepID=A0A7G9L6R7_9FLAO|nr:T9SS type A sorting domain-containing protein [Polaribacter pectinis]QNM84316.1 T9SS type A sorting domain-containing protein [Polaribacter pectinis]